MRQLRALGALFWLSFRRLLWSSSTLMVLFPLLGAGLFLVRYRARHLPAGTIEDLESSLQRFSDVFVIPLFTLFLLPIVALAYATSSIGGDREDRTLLFLLVRPTPRWLILLAKYCATLPLVVGLVISSFWVYCRIAGPTGELAWELYLQPVLGMSVAYVSLFHLFAVSFRHSTIGALVYALFMELLLGNMPGVIKRVAISFYGRSLIYDRGRPFGLHEPRVFEGIPQADALGMLAAIALGGLLLAMFIFQHREYRDLT